MPILMDIEKLMSGSDMALVGACALRRRHLHW